MVADFMQNLIAPVVEAAGFRLVRARLTGGQRKTLQVMAERPDGGMDVEDCAKLSRALSEVLDEADPLPDDYVLEVSSPGIDRPLVTAADFARFAGHEARLELARGLEGRKRFKGELTGCEGDDVLIAVTHEGEPAIIRIPLADISEAKLTLTDKLIRESLKKSEKKQA
jgi:ribosome maturation factor RimP